MIHKKNILPVFVGTALAALVYVSYRAGLMDVLELKSLDRRFQMRGSIPPTAPIVLVSIDHDSFAELNLPWPWPRDLHAALIRKLAKAGAKIIAFDVLFTEPKADAREDQQLASAIKEAGNVVLAAEITDVVTNFGPS
jgi:adenylate cyclase